MQGVAVDLGVDRRGLHAAMAQKLADLRQGRPGAQKVRCRGVAQAMRVDAPEVGAPGGIRYNTAHPAWSKGMMRREVPHKDRPALGVRRSGMAQVFGQSPADIRRKGHQLVAVALAAHADRARAPVDVVEPEPRDLVTPQAEADEQGQNGQIAVANNRAGIAGRKKAPHLIGFKPLGQPGQPAAQDRRRDRDKRALGNAVQMQKAEERPQRRDCHSRRRSSGLGTTPPRTR